MVQVHFKTLFFLWAKTRVMDTSWLTCFLRRLKIEDEGLVKDKLAAWACIRLDRLQQGYRFIDLKDAYGKPSAGKLLVKIEKEVR